jgi:hypothetical protein
MHRRFCLSRGSHTVWQLALPVGIDAAVHAKVPEQDFTTKLIPALLKKSIALMEDIDTAFYHNLSHKFPHTSSTHLTTSSDISTCSTPVPRHPLVPACP